MQRQMKLLGAAVIGILLIAVTVLATLLVKNQATPPDDETRRPPPPLAELGDGQEVTKEKIQEKKIVTTEPKRVDTGRLQATYQVGKTYISAVKASLASKGSYKDWGITTDMTFNYGAEFQISRFIRSNNGSRMEVDVQVDRACNVSIFSQIEGIKIELGAVFQSLLEIGGAPFGLPPGYSEVSKQGLNKLLNQRTLRDYCSEIVSDETAKTFAYVDALQGKKARIVFENGKGVMSITPVGCSLSSDDQLFFEQFSMCSDITMMESLDCRPGDTWNVAGKDFLSVLDPSMKSKVNGSVTIVRKEDLGGGGSPEARLEITGGVLTFDDRYQTKDGKVQSHGSWAPKGQFVFDFGQKIVTEAELKGSVDLVEQSTDHVLFEMKNVNRPVFEVVYSSWILGGDQLKETPKLTRPVKEGTLDALRNRMNR